MAAVFCTDDSLWNESKTLHPRPFIQWNFGYNSFWIGDTCCNLHPNGLTAFELALFDVHFLYWCSRVDDGQHQYTHNYNYHTRLRSSLEDHFLQTKRNELLCPEVLTPWLWRTFCGCPHTPEGREMFKKIAIKYGFWNDVGMPTPCLVGANAEIFMLRF
jgi:hypothetical protein